MLNKTRNEGTVAAGCIAHSTAIISCTSGLDFEGRLGEDGI